MKTETLAAKSANQPIHTRLREWLIAHIDSFPTGSKLPTEYELAERFGISRLTVHKVFNQLQSDGYVTRIRSKGTFVARKDQRIRANSAGAKGTVIIAYPDWFSYDIWAKVERAEIQAVKHGYSLINLKLTRLGGYSLLESLVAEFDDLRGVIVVPPGGIVSKPDIAFLDSLNTPVVILCDIDGVDVTRNLSTVSQNMDEIARINVETAVSQGVRKMAHIGAEPWNPLLERFSRTLRHYAEGRIELVMPTPSTQAWNDSPAKAYEMASKIFQMHSGIDALVADSFPTALATSRAAHDAGCGEMLMLVNAPYFGLERFLRQKIILVYSSLKSIVAEAFTLIGEPQSNNQLRRRQIGVEITTPGPNDPVYGDL